jgi:hypothetical protein
LSIPLTEQATKQAAEGSDTMTAIYGMMAMMPVLFASAGYVLVSSGGTAESKDCKVDD